MHRREDRTEIQFHQQRSGIDRFDAELANVFPRCRSLSAETIFYWRR
jgi:hypothetical protein